MDYTETIHEAFDNNHDITIKIDDTKHDLYHVSLNSDKTILCCKIKMNETSKQIHIDLITKCSQSGFIGSGKYIIEKLQKLSQILQYKLIVDYDVSKISVNGVSVWLGYIYMLSRGMSWYNSLGFLDEDFNSTHEKTLQYIQSNTTKFNISPITQPEFDFIHDDIEFIKNKHTLTEIFTRVFSTITKLSNTPMVGAADKKKTELITQFSKSVETNLKKMQNANIFLFHKKFSDLVYVPPPAGSMNTMPHIAATEPPPVFVTEHATNAAPESSAKTINSQPIKRQRTNNNGIKTRARQTRNNGIIKSARQTRNNGIKTRARQTRNNGIKTRTRRVKHAW